MASIANCECLPEGHIFWIWLVSSPLRGVSPATEEHVPMVWAEKKNASPQKPWEGIRGYRFERPADSVSPLGSWEWFDMIQTYPNTSSVKYQKRGVPTNLYLSLSETNCTHPATLPSNPNHTIPSISTKKNKNSLPINYSYLQHSSHLPTPMFHFLQLFSSIFQPFRHHITVRLLLRLVPGASTARPPRPPKLTVPCALGAASAVSALGATRRRGSSCRRPSRARTMVETVWLSESSTCLSWVSVEISM